MVHLACHSQTEPSETALTSGHSLDHKSQLTSHGQVQSPLHVPCRTLGHRSPTPLFSHASSPTGQEHTQSGSHSLTVPLFLCFLVQPPGMPLPASLALEASSLLCESLPSLIFLSVSAASAPITETHQSSGCFPCLDPSSSILLSLQGSPRSLPL